MSIRNHRNELTSICRHSKKCLSILVFSYVTIFVPKVMHTTIVYDFNQIVAAKYHNLATTGYFSEEMNWLFQRLYNVNLRKKRTDSLFFLPNKQAGGQIIDI